MKKIISLFFLFCIFSSIVHGESTLSSSPIEIGTIQSLQITKDPFNDQLQATVLAKPITSTAQTKKDLDIHLSFAQIHTEGNGLPPKFSLLLITHGTSSFQPKDIKITLQGVHPNTLTLSPREITRTSQDPLTQTTVLYPLPETSLLLTRLKDKTVGSFTVACNLDNGITQTHTFALSSHLKEELQNLVTLDLSQRNTFELTQPK